MKIEVNKLFPYLLILSVIAAAIEIDLCLPSFPEMAKAFSVTEEVVARTISLNFLGFAISALFYGPLADHFGRRPLMLFGNLLFLLGSIGSVLAFDISFLLFFRFIQGLGAAASFVIVFTMISDVYQGIKATKWIGITNAMNTTMMAAAPILGGLINAQFGWRGGFGFIAFFTAIVMILLLLYLPETRKGQSISFKQVIKDYFILTSSKTFMQAAFIPTLLSSGYMAFVAFVPFYYQDQLKLSLTSYSLHQATMIIAFSITSYFASTIANYFGEKKAALRGLLGTMITTSALLTLSILTPYPSAWIITPLMCIEAITCAVAFSVVFSSSLAIYPEKNGSASSFIMSFRMLICAITVQLTGLFYNGYLFPTALIVCSCSVFAYLLAVRYYQTAESKEIVKSQDEQLL